MVIFYKKWKKYNEFQLTKNKMDLNIRKITNHPPSPDDHSNHSQTEKRHAHPRPALQPLMLVNSQKSGHLGQGCGKD